MNKHFVPKSFSVPLSLKTDQFLLEVLTPSVVELDYDAVMSSRVRLRCVFAPSTTWPSDNMSIEENKNDLKRHEKEFLSREAFAYTVLSLDKQTCLGCIYITPSNTTSFDSEVYLWVRDDHIDLDQHLFATVKNWLKSDWPFQAIAYPGRDIGWTDWRKHTKTSYIL
jgi:hypothetical protein